MSKHFDPMARGHHSSYREHETNHCPGCGRKHWHIGRLTAECAFCSTAIPLETAMVSQPAKWPTFVGRFGQPLKFLAA